MGDSRLPQRARIQPADLRRALLALPALALILAACSKPDSQPEGVRADIEAAFAAINDRDVGAYVAAFTLECRASADERRLAAEWAFLEERVPGYEVRMESIVVASITGEIARFTARSRLTDHAGEGVVSNILRNPVGASAYLEAARWKLADCVIG